MNTETICVVLFTFILFQTWEIGLPCSVKCNPCMDLICPEVQVETSSPPLQLPSSPYFSRTDAPIMPGCTSYQFPPYPYPPMPLPMPMPMQTQPPSYCIQSVVVGGKADVNEEKKNRTVQRVSVEGHHSEEPIVKSGASSEVSQHQEPGASNQTKDDQPSNIDRYEQYVQKLLSVMQDRLNAEPESVAPSPMMIVAPGSYTSHDKEKKSNKRTHTKYTVSSCEEDAEPVVYLEQDEEEQQQQPPYDGTRPSCCCCYRPNCCCRPRPYSCGRSCCR